MYLVPTPTGLRALQGASPILFLSQRPRGGGTAKPQEIRHSTGTSDQHRKHRPCDSIFTQLN